MSFIKLAKEFHSTCNPIRANRRDSLKFFYSFSIFSISVHIVDASCELRAASWNAIFFVPLSDFFPHFTYSFFQSFIHSLTSLKLIDLLCIKYSVFFHNHKHYMHGNNLNVGRMRKAVFNTAKMSKIYILKAHITIGTQNLRIAAKRMRY